MNNERKIHVIAGIINGAGLLLGLTVSPWWFILSGIVALNLFIDGITGWCIMRIILRKIFP